MLATSVPEDTVMSTSASPSNARILTPLSNSPRSKGATSLNKLRCSMNDRGGGITISRFQRKEIETEKDRSSTTSQSLPSAQSLKPGMGNGGGGGQQKYLRRSNAAVSLKRKKRVIQMLGVVVAEFFICWTPLYVMNTWYLFYPQELYSLIGNLGVSLIQILAYTSSCSNPITYCFMNRGFRMSFFHVFGCHCSPHRSSPGPRNDSIRLSRARSTNYSNYYGSNHQNTRSFRKPVHNSANLG